MSHNYQITMIAPAQQATWPPARWTLRTLAQLAPTALRAIVALARARIAFARLRASDIPRLNARAQSGTRDEAETNPSDRELLARIAYVMPRVAGRLPWRSDCLVQALAGQRWLVRAGIASTIVIGVDPKSAQGFMAHAWLRHGGQVVTGGAIAQYTVLLD